MDYEPKCTIKRPFCDCDASAVLTTAIYDQLASNGTNVEIGFFCPLCTKYYGYWVSDPSYWLLCKAIEENIGLVTFRLSGDRETHVHPSYKSRLLEVEVGNDATSDLCSR